MAAGTAVATRPASGATASQGRAPAPVVPFVRASRQESQQAFDTGAKNLAAGVVQLGPIEVPPAGFLRYIDLEVTIAGSNGGSANTAFNADGAFLSIAQISLQNSAGDTLVVPMTGYQLYLMQKWGMYANGPYDDPKLDVNYSTTTGTGATGGSATFFLRVPGELSARDAFGAVPNMAANRAYVLQMSAAALSTIYATQPSAGGTIRVQGVAYFWGQPRVQTDGGTQQQPAPNGVGSVVLWRYQSIALTPGDKLLKLANVGNVIRCLIFVLRNSSGARIGASTDWPATSQILLNNLPIFYKPYDNWLRDMCRFYGYTAAAEAAGGRDTGVFVLSEFNNLTGNANQWGPRDQLLPTVDATLLQLRGTSFGANVSTLEVLSQEIKPSSGAALFGY